MRFDRLAVARGLNRHIFLSMKTNQPIAAVAREFYVTAALALSFALTLAVIGCAR